MSAFTVELPGGTKTKEFQAYANLLQEWGVDTGRLARAPETNTERRWLHTWQSRLDAERFAAELREHTGNPEWSVREIEDGRMGDSELPPVTLFVVHKDNGIVCRLEEEDRKRIKATFPNVNVLPSITINGANLDALEQAVLDPWGQIATLLTGLGEEQLSQLGGARIVEQQTGKVLWSPAKPLLNLNAQDNNASMETWIDKHTQPDQLEQVLAYLTNYMIGKDPQNLGGIPHPPSSGYEGLLWPWNRAGGRFLDRGLPVQAAEVWAGCYLSLLSLQERYKFRTHKGMPLCNMGIAFLRAQDSETAILSWFLGLVEDTMTNPDTCMETQNFKNLLSVEVPETAVKSFALGIQSRFSDPFVTVALPELAFHIGSKPNQRSFHPDVLAAVERLLSELARAFPQLPKDVSPVESIRRVWSVIRKQ